MARRDQVENVEAENTEAAAVEGAEVAQVEGAEVAQVEDAPDEPILPGTVTVENAVSEDQLREKVRRMLKGRKNYELCGVLKSNPGTISNFVKGKGNVTKQMLAGLGVRPVLTYVVDDVEAFNSETRI